MSERALVILTLESLKIYSSDGDVYQVPLPMKFSRIYNLDKGIVAERQLSKFDSQRLPFLFSLMHPLEEFSPVCYTDKDVLSYQHFKYFSDPSLCFLSITDGIALAFHEKSQSHYIFTIHHIQGINSEDIMESETPEPQVDNGGDIESQILFKLLKVGYDEFKGPLASSVFVENRHLTLYKRDLKLAYHFLIEEELLKPNYILKDVLSIVPVTTMSQKMFLVLDSQNSLSLYFEKYKVCQIDTNGLEIVELNGAVNDTVTVITKNAIFRLHLSCDILSEPVDKCWQVLMSILPLDIYISLLREYLVTNEHVDEWRTFCKIFFSHNKEVKESLKPYIANITYSLHLLYETFKLSILTIPHLKSLASLLCTLASYLQWKKFCDLYFRDFDLPLIHGDLKSPTLPNIYEWIYHEKYENFPFGNFDIACLEKLYQTVKLFVMISSHDEFLQQLIAFKISRSDIDLYPFGIAKRFKSVLEKIKLKPSNNLVASAYNLIERQDLAFLFQKDFEPQFQFYDFEKKTGKNVFSDKRLEQIYSKLSSTSPIKSPEDTDINYQEFLIKSSKRICSNSIGRGMVSLSSRVVKDEINSLFVVPNLVIAVKTLRNVVASLDMSQMAPNALLWPEFHHGASYGMSILSPEKITREWILFQKPNGPNCYFSGFLLSLGLNGHLKEFLATDVYSLLHAKHMPTTVAAFLGVCVSKRGSQDMNLTKALSLHIPSLTSSSELEIAQETQSASLISLGYLYLETGHRFISEILLTELCRTSDDLITDREGYALAAGIGLGLVNLGKANSSQGLTDLKITEKLKLYMLGGKRKTVATRKTVDYSTKIKESDQYVNTIVSSNAATLCLCLMYLQTNDVLVASYMEIPKSKYLLEFIKPSQAYLRTLCRNLILWNDIVATESWVLGQVIRNSEDEEDSEDEVAALNAHIISGACMAIGMKYAGSNSKEAQKVILSFLSKFEGSNVESLTKETCLLMNSLALSLVCAGSGNVDIVKVFNRIRKTQVTYGSHMALSMALGMNFLGGCRFSLSTSKFAIANLLICTFPRFPSVSTENKFHLQALRHFYVLAAEPRFLETVNVSGDHEVSVEMKVVLENDELILKTPCLLPQIDKIKSIHIEDDEYYPLHITHENQIKRLKNMKIYLKKKSYEQDQRWLKPLAMEIKDNMSLWNLKLSFDESMFFENCFARLERNLVLEYDLLKQYLLDKNGNFDSKFAMALVLYDIPCASNFKAICQESGFVMGNLAFHSHAASFHGMMAIEKMLKEI